MSKLFFLDSTRENFSCIKTWNVSNVTDMSYMFNGAINFNSDLSEWNVSNVIDIGYTNNLFKLKFCTNY